MGSIVSVPNHCLSFYFRQLSYYVATEEQKLCYSANILPYVDYGSLMWGSVAGTPIERLSKLQKQTSQIILREEFNARSKSLVGSRSQID